MNADSPRCLLFGLLALQNGLIDQVQLIAAFQAWTRDKGRSLGEHLQARGDLDPDDRSAVEALVGRHIKKHGGDAERSLAAVAVGPSTRAKLTSLADPDINATLGPVSAAPAPTDPDSDRTGTCGAASDGLRFRVLRPHARGGLGEVLVALDQELHREVALKQILEHHADNPISRARFLIEAEITGGLEHPGIVPVYGLGQGGDGRPYYAMRLIRGDTLKEAIATFHSDPVLKKNPGQRSLALRALLRRFVEVCDAIDYAHVRGVLHRDIKPSNIIVGKYGETLVVDWGLAKSMGQSRDAVGSDERTLIPSSASGTAETLPGSAMGTPAFMSPEQAAGDLDRIGPSSDIYSLGATLYSLLTGTSAFEGSDVGAVLRSVQKGDFPAPRTINAAIPPALESICLKAMANRPEDRYPSAKALAEDIERWSADEPVSAHRDALPIRLGRWARKHRTTVAVAAGLLQTAVVVLAVAAVLLGQSRARVEEQRKIAALARDRAQAINKFFVDDLLAQADPSMNPIGDKLTVRELLDRCAKSLDADNSLAARPGVESAVRAAIGNAYWSLGLWKLAETNLERAASCQLKAPDVPAAERLAVRNSLNWVHYKLGGYPPDRLNNDLTSCLQEATTQLGPDHDVTIQARINIVNSNGRLESLREVFEIQKRRLGRDHRLTCRAASNLASKLLYRLTAADAIEAESIIRENLAIAARTGSLDDPDSLFAADYLGLALIRQGRFAEARAHLTPLRERFDRVMGPDNFQQNLLLEDIALAEEGLGNLDEARKLHLKVMELRKAEFADSFYIQRGRVYLARLDLAQGRSADALNKLQLLVSSAPADSKGLDEILRQEADAADVDAHLGQLATLVQRYTGKEDWFPAYFRSLLGVRKLRLGMSDEAGPMLAESVKSMEQDKKTPARFLAEARARAALVNDPAFVGLSLIRRRKFAEALGRLVPLVAPGGRVPGPDELDRATLLEAIAAAEEGLGRFDQARVHYLEARALRKAQPGDSAFRDRRSLALLARVDLADGHEADALARLHVLLDSAEDKGGKRPNLDGFDQILSGRGDPVVDAKLLGRVRAQLAIGLGVDDWMVNYFEVLRVARNIRLGKVDGAEMRLRSVINAMEKDPLTPARFLAEARACAASLAANRNQPAAP